MAFVQIDKQGCVWFVEQRDLDLEEAWDMLVWTMGEQEKEIFYSLPLAC